MNTSFENRTMNFWSKNIQDYYHEAEKEILEKIKIINLDKKEKL
jgi:hypothetical protein